MTATFLVVAPSASAILTLTAGPESLLTPFEPGKVATATGSLIATDTNPSWTLQAQDLGSGAGSLVASATGCSDSASKLSNPLQVSVTSNLGGVTTGGQITMTPSKQTVASASNHSLAASSFTTNYGQSIPATEVMLTGCVYTITVTYTLQ